MNSANARWTKLHFGLLLATIVSVSALNLLGDSVYQSLAPAIAVAWLTTAPVVGLLAIKSSKRGGRTGLVVLNIALLLVWFLALYTSQLHWSLSSP